jgi:zinc protease
MIFSEMSLLEKGMNLAWNELLGDADLINNEIDKYLQVTAADITRQANKLFRKDNSSTLIYLAEKMENSEVGESESISA